jgi:disulfide bond formation protein DsbB
VKWLWLAGAVALLGLGFGAYHAAMSPAFWSAAIAAAAGAAFKFLRLHGRDWTPAERQAYRQGNTRPPQPWRSDGEDHR